jgi:hypothetical protein
MKTLSEQVFSDDLSNAKLVLKYLDELVQEGYRENCLLICEKMRDFSQCNYPMRILVRMLCESDNFLRLVSAQSFIIFGCESFYLRLNFWLPAAPRPDLIAERFRQYFSINVLHNHAFDFFTVGVFGDGYESDIYEALDRDLRSDLIIGEKVELSQKCRIKLSKGKSIFFPKFSVFHTQYEPTALSASLNLIPRNMDRVGYSHGRQYVLDQQNFAIRKIFETEN